MDERAAAYRTLLEGRRMLVVLDNARAVEQVRPLLPGSPSSLVLVTSRESLAGLVARHGARRLDLDTLPQQEAVALLRALIGDRAEAEPDATAMLARQCARLPLALRVAAELAAASPEMTVAELAASWRMTGGWNCSTLAVTRAVRPRRLLLVIPATGGRVGPDVPSAEPEPRT